MFVQIFKGQVDDADAVRSVLDDWMDKSAPAAAVDGWIGSTGGVGEGTFIAVGLFASAEAARRNGDREGQGEWWSRLEKLFTGPVTFHNCTKVDIGRRGGVPEAGFVQVIEGKTSDIARMRALSDRLEEHMADRRPDLLGTVVAFHDEELGAFTQVMYFSTEEEARRGEQEVLTGDALGLMSEMFSLTSGVTFLDLHTPWLDWPR